LGVLMLVLSLNSIKIAKSRGLHWEWHKEVKDMACTEFHYENLWGRERLGDINRDGRLM
jgi:hypothetical protein